MDLGLTNKTALVSGSTAGIGRAIAEELSSEGAAVIINGRSVDSVRTAIHEMGDDSRLFPFPGDLSREENVDRLIEEFPAVDIIVNNLGVFRPAQFEEIPDEEWRRLFEVNVLSGVRISRAYLSHMRRQNWGRILFVSSESGLHIPPEMVHYGVTKAAQIAVARGIAESVAGTGITANSILPGPTESRGVKDFVNTIARERGKSFGEFESDFFAEMRPTSLIKRFAKSDEVAALAAYLCSRRASATTGAALRVDGGVVKSAF